MTKSDLLVLILTTKPGICLGPIKLHKSVFLVQKGCRGCINKEFDFTPDAFGPFSVDVPKEAESLPELIRISYKFNPTLNKYYSQVEKFPEYSATVEAFDYAKSIDVDPKVREYAKKVVDWVLPMSFEDIVKSICRKYPEYLVEGLFRLGKEKKI